MESICAHMHITAKPIGPRCNLNCDYCFYWEKEKLFPREKNWRISPTLLEAFIKKYINSQPGPEVSFLWQGGEPMLMGLGFYKEVVRLQQKYAAGKRIHNAIQTNGTLLDEDWCRFLKQAGFLVGLSLDGPADVHDAYRHTRSGKGSHEVTMKGLLLLQEYGVDFNILCCVNAASSGRGSEIYHWFLQQGIKYIQFAPVIERVPTPTEKTAGLRNAEPSPGDGPLASYSIQPEDYGHFLCDVFDCWVQKDVGRVFVMNFEWALERWMGLPATYCVFAEECGKALALEHNGDVYVCDHFVYPAYRLGNLEEQDFAELLSHPAAIDFQKKKKALPSNCQGCDFLFACNGECPKNRILPGGENILCPGYYLYFAHIQKTMDRLKEGLVAGRTAEETLYLTRIS